MDKLQFLLLILYISYNLGAPSQTILRFCKWTVLNETLAFFVRYFVNRDRDQWRIGLLVATACNGCNYQLNATTDYVTKGRFPLVPRNLPFVLWRQPTTGTGGSCPTARAQQARGAKWPHQKYLRIANTKVSIIKFDALAKVAYRNKHLLFWLPTCLGISSTAWHLTFKTRAPLPPRKKNRGGGFCPRAPTTLVTPLWISFFHRVHRLTTLIIHCPLTLSFQA